MSDSVFPKVRFSLKALMITMLIVAAWCWFVDRQIHTRAHFKILETDLQIEGGHISGAISFRCSQFNKRDNIEYSNTVLYVKEIAEMKMSNVKTDDEFSIRYRALDWGPIAKENPYIIFMIRELGIKKEEIVGFVQLDGWAEVHVRGKSEESP